MKPACLCVLVTCALATMPPTVAADEATDLDVTRVALFSSGVGYFECDARVEGEAFATLKFRTDQINDILKSMVVQDYDGGRIGAISYASRDPIEKTLRSFGVDLTGKPTLGGLLDQLRGEPVELSGPRTVAGSIVGVETQKRMSDDGQTVEIVELLTILTPEGLERVDIAQLRGIRLTNEKVDAELRKALATLALAHDADKKTVELNFDGTGQRRVRVAYLLEAPIWKTSYRLVLSDDDKPLVQGWATVENATEEDWNNVRLSLVSGRPISFRMDLYTPLYVPRPIEQLELYASLRPPSYEGGFDVAEAEPSEAMAKRPMVRRSGGGSAGGRGAARGELGRLESLGYAGDRAEEMAGVRLGEAGVESIATALEAGELFEYRIDTPVSIPRQHSAMLPIVNQEIEGEKVSIYNPNTHAKHPLNGLELKNTTGLNLMQGPVTVFDADIYAGDAKLPDLKPDEKRLIAYALDLSTEVMIKQESTPARLMSLRIAKGTLWHRHKHVDRREYVVKNKADRERSVILEQGYSDDWKLIEPKEPYERTENLLRFRLKVPGKQTVEYPVELERIVDQSIRLSDTSLGSIDYYLRSRVISPAVKQALEKVIALRAELDALERLRARYEKEHSEAVAQQGRVRENLKVLDKDSDAYRRQLKIFEDLETQIGKLSEQIATSRDAEEQKRKALETYLLSLDVE